MRALLGRGGATGDPRDSGVPGLCGSANCSVSALLCLVSVSTCVSLCLSDPVSLSQSPYGGKLEILGLEQNIPIHRLVSVAPAPYSGLENDLGASCTLSLQCDWWVILGVTRGSMRSLGFHRGRKVWVVIAHTPQEGVSVELGSGWSTMMSGGLGGEWGPGGGMWAIRHWWVPANWLCPSLCHRLIVLDCGWLWCWSPGWPLSQPQGGRWCTSCPHS